MTIIINQRAYYIIIYYYVVCCPARLSPNGLTGVKSLMTRIVRVFAYIYTYYPTDGCSDGGVP